MNDQKTLILRYAEIMLIESRLVRGGERITQELIDEKHKIESELSLSSDEILKKARQMLSS